MPWTCDALLPTELRYSSPKFRRVARGIRVDRLDYADAAELCAFVHTIDGVKYARKIFMWRAALVRDVERLLTHMDQFPHVATMVAENRASPTRAEGLAVLDAMRDGWWTQGSVPGVVRLALLDMRDAGISQPKIAAMTGLTHDQVRVMANGGRWHRPASVGLAGLVAE